ncbi:MAG: electron transport complex subunit G [marine bacterium B5-7]|nr:MAG: electron transport complex subunit G [marine bacterium B5-7]
MNLATHSFKQKLITLLPLVIISVICVISIFLVNENTKDKITSNKQKAALAIINEVLPVEYDNDLFTDKIKLEVPVKINNIGNITAYRARLDNQPVAVSLMPIMTKGYNGDISLIIGIRYDGSLAGVRVLQDNETEGFGGQAHQDKTDWLQDFNNTSLASLPEKKWAIKKDEGGFDQLSGATITSRSIINVIYTTLNYYSEHRDEFYNAR